MPGETCAAFSEKLSLVFRINARKFSGYLTHVNEGFGAISLPQRLTNGRAWRICKEKAVTRSTLPDETCAPRPPRPALRQVVVRASVTTADDVSSLESPPAVGLREWASGARPVVGALAASSLMLLACSWFAFSSGVIGAGRDVGRPDPVRIGGTTPQLVGGPLRPAAQPAVHGRVDVGARRSSPTGAAASTPDVRQTSESGPEPGAPAATGPGPASTRAATPSVSPASPATASSDATASPAPPPLVPEDVTSNLPAPLDDLPSVPLPPVTPPVTVPDLSIPTVPTVTTILGVP